MLAQWIANTIGKMHQHKITAVELAAECDYHPKYLSAILNGHREPRNAERVINDALDRIIKKKTKAS